MGPVEELDLFSRIFESFDTFFQTILAEPADKPALVQDALKSEEEVKPETEKDTANGEDKKVEEYTVEEKEVEDKADEKKVEENVEKKTEVETEEKEEEKKDDAE